MRTIGAIEAGGTKFVLALAGADGSILERERIETGRPAITLARVADWFGAAAKRHGPLGAFGIGSFGPLDLDRTSPDWGRFTTTPKPGWSGASWPETLGRFGVPIALDTDVNAAALGEWLAGAGRGSRTLAYTTVGTGIGTGLLGNGVALAGESHFEAGHIPVKRARGDDWPGLCPYHGDCLEGLASGPAILERWGHDLGQASVAEIARVARYLAQLAASLVLLHRPDRMIFGGGVMKGAGLIEALREAPREVLGGYIAGWNGTLDDRIVSPALGDDAGIVGAIELARRAR
ncbi:ROK family protein [Tsuneonella sp. SYSU-LHT278]|uniref:ROK family protein n=1 Tax=Tsuneonella sediminis TaxID=3416089 RepID=UPI003F78CBF3